MTKWVGCKVEGEWREYGDRYQPRVGVTVRYGTNEAKQLIACASRTEYPF